MLRLRMTSGFWQAGSHKLNSGPHSRKKLRCYTQNANVNERSPLFSRKLSIHLDYFYPKFTPLSYIFNAFQRNPDNATHFVLCCIHFYSLQMITYTFSSTVAWNTKPTTVIYSWKKEVVIVRYPAQVWQQFKRWSYFFFCMSWSGTEHCNAQGLKYGSNNLVIESSERSTAQTFPTFLSIWNQIPWKFTKDHNTILCIVFANMKHHCLSKSLMETHDYQCIICIYARLQYRVTPRHEF